MKPRILVMVGQPVRLTMVHWLLERAGWVVTTAVCGDTALAILACERFDAMLTDLETPSRHGLEVIRAVRALRPNLPIIAVASEATVHGQNCARAVAEAGGDAFLPKPVCASDLFFMLAKAQSCSPFCDERDATVLAAAS